jgi:transposase-like protein
VSCRADRVRSCQWLGFALGLTGRLEEARGAEDRFARVAREHGANANQVFQWRYEYREGILPPRAKEARAELLPVTLADWVGVNSLTDFRDALSRIRAFLFPPCSPAELEITFRPAHCVGCS